MTIFDQMQRDFKFTALPTEYTDRYTPEMAREQGKTAGRIAEIEYLLDVIDDCPRPTQQLRNLASLLQDRLEALNES